MDMESQSHQQMLKRLSMIPPGYRFCPRDEELFFYLRNKIKKQILPDNKIMIINLYEHTPQDLSVMYREFMQTDKSEKNMYFFTPRDRKYPKGRRPNRAAKDGYWKATGTFSVIRVEGNPIGYKRTLVYYQGNHKESIKTKWTMREYRVDEESTSSSSTATSHNMKLDDWVLCEVYLKKKKKENSETDDEANPTNDMAAPVLNHNSCSASLMAAHLGNNCWATPNQGNNCWATPNQGNNCWATPNQGNNCWATPTAAHQYNNYSATPDQDNNGWATPLAANQDNSCIATTMGVNQGNNCSASPMAAHQGNNCWDTPLAAHQGNNCWDTPLAAHQGNNCWDTTMATNQGNSWCPSPMAANQGNNWCPSPMVANQGNNWCPSPMAANQGIINEPLPLDTNYTHTNYFREYDQQTFDDGFDLPVPSNFHDQYMASSNYDLPPLPMCLRSPPQAFDWDQK